MNEAIKTDIEEQEGLKIDKKALSSSFFSSLSPVQQKQFTIIVGDRLAQIKQYRDFKRGFLTKGFILFLWERKLWHEILEPTKINASMWRLLMFIWALKHTKKYIDEPITRKIIYAEIGTMGRILRLWPTRNIAALEKYGWLSSQRGHWHTKKYFLTEKSYNLIKTYSVAYSRYVDNFFDAPH